MNRVTFYFLMDKRANNVRKQAYTVMNSVLSGRMNRGGSLDIRVQVTYNSFSNVYD